jgi:hypothetical protein
VQCLCAPGRNEMTRCMRSSSTARQQSAVTTNVRVREVRRGDFWLAALPGPSSRKSELSSGDR